MKSLLVTLALISASPSFINQAHSNEVLIAKDTNSEDVDQSKKTYTSEGKEIQTVIAIGIGTSPQGAAQNAAENALTQVVGSFIDAETILTKKTEIRDGVVAKSKELSKKISDYSQGSIKSFEILNTSQNGSIYNVTARVDVRIEDFRAYIKELAYGSKKINTGLFSVIKTEEDNIQGKLDLLARILKPLKDGQVVDIEIGNPERLQDISSFGCILSVPNFAPSWDPIIICDGVDKAQERYDIRDFNKTNTIAIPFSFKIKKEFFENAINILENISNEKKVRKLNSPFESKYFSYDEFNSRNKTWKYREDYRFIIINNKKKELINFFIPQVRLYDSKRSNNKVNLYYKQNTNTTQRFCELPNISISFKDKNSNLIYAREFFSCNPLINVRSFANRDIRDPFKIKILNIYGNNLSPYGQVSDYYSYLKDSSEFILLIEPNEELLNNLHEISIEYVQR